MSKSKSKSKDLLHHHHLHFSEKPFSLLQSNELFATKILSRNSSFGRSARGLPACRLPGQIPFNWEAQPGLPKNHPQPSETLPPLDILPPAAGSKSPHVTPMQEEPAAVKVWFWKKPKRKVRHVVVAKKTGSRRHVVDRDQIQTQSPLCSKENDHNHDDESSTSSSLSCISYSLSNSSGSSSAASSSSNNGYDRRRSKLGSLAKGFIRWAF